MATEAQKAYTAGLIDGEGCIDIGINKSLYNRGLAKNPQYIVRVTIHMTDVAPLEYLQSIFGGSVIKRNRTAKSYKPHWKDSYDWKIASKSATDLLAEIEPYLINKREQALVALEFTPNVCGVKLTSEDHSKRSSLRDKLKALKRAEKGELSWQLQ